MSGCVGTIKWTLDVRVPLSVSALPSLSALSLGLVACQQPSKPTSRKALLYFIDVAFSDPRVNRCDAVLARSQLDLLR